jgi:hypothetical protein
VSADLLPGWKTRRSGLAVPAALAGSGKPRLPRGEAVARSGRPSYANQHGKSYLKTTFSHKLLAQFYDSIPALSTSVGILAGMVGTPKLAGATDAETKELEEWAAALPVGHIAQGLQAWLVDHVAQALVYGYAVGEAEINPARDEVSRLWSYVSPQFVFEAEPDGSLIVKQLGQSEQQGLNPITVLTTTYNPVGCDPRGRSLFQAIPTVSQIWMDMLHALRQTCRRIGIETFHVNWDVAIDELDDVQGEVAEAVREEMQESWNAAMKSQAIDGLAKDFFSTGKIKVEPIGGLSEIPSIQDNKRAIVEEVVVATNIPPWMLGYSWSTTERLSQQQADMLIAKVEGIRRCATSSLQKLAALRQQIRGKRGPVSIEWEVVNLQDAVEQAKARLLEAQADIQQQRYATENWRLGYWDQEQAAEHTTGSDEVATPMEEPPSAMPAAEDDDTPDPLKEDGESVASLLAELDEADYGAAGFGRSCGHGH